MSPKQKAQDDLIWGYLLHLGYNMWFDREVPDIGVAHLTARPHLRVEMEVWNDVLEQLKAAGANMVVIDLGEGIRYKSHPELAVRGSWGVKRLRKGLKRIRKMGIEPIPKLNFSACHDVWLGPYSRCVSTDPYYCVCKDLIAEVIDLFEKPRFFHLGMDEETAGHQRNYSCAVMRQHDLWWHDLEFLTDRVDRKGVRPWVWSDYVWKHPEEFHRRMPKSVLQSNWYYGQSFSQNIKAVKAYVGLEAHGYDQIPTGSNWTVPENFGKTVAHAADHIARERLLGFLQTTWRPALSDCRERHAEAIQQLAEARSGWEPAV